MKFDFEQPNTLPSLNVERRDEQITQDMLRVSKTPPQYDQRTLSDVQYQSPLDGLDPLDASAVATNMYNSAASDYAKSGYHKQFSTYVKSKKQG